MSPKRRFNELQDRPTAQLDGEIWIQCHLRLTFQFQARHGVSLHLCDPSRRCLRIGLGEILDDRSGRSIYNAMLYAEIEDEFQEEYLEQLAELDHLDPESAGRLAFNLVMDSRWEQIEKAALAYCESEAEINSEISAA